MNQKTGAISVLRTLIPSGQENAISTASLMEAAGYSDTRLLRHDIRQLRIAGEVILSSTQKGGGYYRPKTSDEIRRFIRQEEHRAKSIFYGLKAARRLLKQTIVEPQASTAETKTPREREVNRQ